MPSRVRTWLLAALCAVFFAPAAFAANCGSDLAEIASLSRLSNYGGAAAWVAQGANPLFQNGGQLTAPAATVALVDSGPLPVGCYLLDVHVANVSDTTADSFVVVHRNATNAGDVCLSNPVTVGAFSTPTILTAAGMYEGYIANANERFVVRLILAATSAKVWQADMTVWPCP